MNIFVTGTDTNVGKTVVSAILCLKLQYRYWKPIQSGTRQETDTAWVGDRIGEEKTNPEIYRLKEPLSPHLSAAQQNLVIDIERIRKAASDRDQMIIEGAGGLLVPLNEKNFVIDLIQSLKAPVLLVARSELGTINHTLLSLEVMRSRGIEPMGVVMVGDLHFDNKRAIEKFGRTKVLGQIPRLSFLDRQTLLAVGAQIHIERNKNGYEKDTEKNNGGTSSACTLAEQPFLS